MALSPARRYENAWRWVVSLFLIIIVWRLGVYGVDWKSGSSVVTLLVAIAALAFCVIFWRRRKQT